jgi:hypothetical protein
MVDVLARLEVGGEAATGTSGHTPMTEQGAGQHREVAAGPHHPPLRRPGLNQWGLVMAQEGVEDRSGGAKGLLRHAIAGRRRVELVGVDHQFLHRLADGHGIDPDPRGQDQLHRRQGGEHAGFVKADHA